MPIAGTFTLKGTYEQLGGAPAAGNIQVDGIPNVIVDATGDKVKVGPKKPTLDTAGSFTITLPTDVTTGTSTTLGYRVTARLKHNNLDPVEFYAPAAGTTLDMADVTPQSVESVGVTGANAAAAQASADAAATSAQLAASNASLSATFTVASNGTADQTTRMNSALSAASSFGVKRIIRFVGDFNISSTLIVPSNTVADFSAATITLIAGSNKRMIRNAAAGGTGARDTGIEIIGGTWEGGSNAASTSVELHVMTWHRVDGFSLSGAKFHTTLGKYAVLIADATKFSIRDLTFDTYSDGVHMQGPLRSGVVRNIRGTTGDDFVAITARDYPQYDLTTGGGSVADVTIEDLFPTNASGNATKIFAGLNNTVSGITVQRIRGSVGAHGICLFHDTAVPTLYGGTIEAVTIRDVDVTPGTAYGSVQISAPGVNDVTADSINVRAGKALTVTPTAVAQSVTLRNVTTAAEFALNLVDVQSGASITDLLLDGVTFNGKTDQSAGVVANVSGTVTRLAIARLRGSNGQAIVFINGSVPNVSLANVTATSTYGIRHTAANACAATVTNGNFTTTLGILRVSGGTGASGSISGSGITSTVAAIARTGTQPLRVNGAQFRADLALLAPTAGDEVYNTNAALSAGSGLCLTDGSTWKNLMTAATYATPFNGTAFLDNFTGVGALNTHVPNTGKAWVDTANGFTIDASGLLSNVISATALAGYFATGDATMTGTLRLTSEATSLLARVLLKYVDSNNYLRINVGGSGVNPTVTIDKVIAGVTTTIATLAGSLGLNADGTTYSAFPFTFSCVGTTVTLTMNGNTATGTLVAGDVTALTSAQKIGLLSTRHLRIDPGLKVDVVGNFAA